jgi:hypothetical protein
VQEQGKRAQEDTHERGCRWNAERAVAGTGGTARNDVQVNCLYCKGSVENEVQDHQYDQRDAKKPAEKIRHDVISFRIEV